jgi:hypothetical protein
VQAASKDDEEEKILAQFTALLERIDLKKHPELRDHPAMQGLIQKAFDSDAVPESKGMPPGTVIGSGLNANAVPWTWQHVQFLHDAECDCGNDPERSCNPKAMYRFDRFTSPRTQQVIINGLSVWFPANEEVRWYKPWIDTMRASMTAEKDAERRAQWFYKVGPWAPNIPAELQPQPNPDWLEGDTVFSSRAVGDGMYRPGMGWNPNVDGRRTGFDGAPAPIVTEPEPEPAAA